MESVATHSGSHDAERAMTGFIPLTGGAIYAKYH
jgi:hypothetical protein